MERLLTKTCAISFLLVSLQLHAFAQEYQLVKGTNYKMSMKEAGWSDIEPIGRNATAAFYILHPYSKVSGGATLGGKNTFIGKVNNEMKFESFEELALEYEGKDMQLEFGLELNNTSFLFSSFENNQLKKTFLFAQTLNKETLKPNGDIIKVAEIDYSKENKYKNASFSYRLSRDSSRVLFIHNLLDKDGTLLSFGYTLTDEKLKPLGALSHITLAEDGIYNFQEYYVSKTGAVYLLVKFFNEKKEYKDNVQLKKQSLLSSTRLHETEANYQYKVLEFKNFSGQPTVMNIALDGAFVTSVDLIPKEAGGLMAIGFYSADGDAIPDGAFAQNIDKSIKKVIRTDMKGLEGQFAQPSKYVNNTYEATGVLKKRDDLTNFRFVLKDIIQKQSGGYALAAERNSTLTKTVNTGRSITTYNVYHTDDIVVIDVDPSGKINWIQKVEKSQQTEALGTLYASFGFKEYKDNLLLFFTDFAEQNVKRFGKVVDTEAYMVSIDPSGKQNRKVVFSAADNELTIKAVNTYEPKKGSYILYGHNGLLQVGFNMVKLD